MLLWAYCEVVEGLKCFSVKIYKNKNDKKNCLYGKKIMNLFRKKKNSNKIAVIAYEEVA